MSSPSYTSFLVAGFLPAANTVQTHFFLALFSSGLARQRSLIRLHLPELAHP
jgi:hypothetical protein